MVGFGMAAVDADLRYNLSKRFYLGFQLGAEAWLGEGITAEKPDGTQLFKAPWLYAYGQLGLGLNF
jgi:hypothetical protein